MSDQATIGLGGPATAALPFVVRVETAGQPVRAPVPLDGPLTFGTAESADVRVDDAAVSRRHVSLTPVGSRVRVIDEGSKNGVFVGGVGLYDGVVSAPVTLTIGRTQLHIDVARRAPAAVAVASIVEFGAFATQTASLASLLQSLRKAAATEVAVLLEGESGTGKELLAEAIHDHSPRREGPFEIVDCAALAPSLIEMELFGHERGAFTGADRARQGAFVRARGGTLFLDEIGELPLDLQTRLLGAIERRQVRPVGGSAAIDLDVRVVAATHRNVERDVEDGRFRLDLFHRVAGLHVRVPPLRERPLDVGLLADRFAAAIGGAASSSLTPELRGRLASHRWPGNVRELKNTIERLLLLGASPSWSTQAPAQSSSSDPLSSLSQSGLIYAQARELVLEAFTARYVEDMLRRHDGNVTRAAAAAGMARRHFHRLKSQSSD